MLYLERRLGTERFDALVRSSNIEAVRQFAYTLPVILTVGVRIYDSFLRFWQSLYFIMLRKRARLQMEDSYFSVANLQRKLGAVRFDALVRPSNIDAVCEFADTLPVPLLIGDRAYDSLRILHEYEEDAALMDLLFRASDLNASLGGEDGRFILDHQEDIPKEWRKRKFLFSGWRSNNDSDCVAYIYYDSVKQKWVVGWDYLGGISVRRDWHGACYVLRRKISSRRRMHQRYY